MWSGLDNQPGGGAEGGVLAAEAGRMGPGPLVVGAGEEVEEGPEGEAGQQRPAQPPPPLPLPHHPAYSQASTFHLGPHSTRIRAF